MSNFSLKNVASKSLKFSILMLRTGHFGIDPRKLGIVQNYKLPRTLNRSSLTLKYNPFILNNRNLGPTMRSHSRLDTSGVLSKKVKKNSPYKIIDKIFEYAEEYNASASLEKGLSEYLDTKDVYVWYNNQSGQYLQCYTLAKMTKYKSSILSFSCRCKEVVLSRKPLLHDNFDMIIDGSNGELLYVPLRDRKDDVVCVVQFIKSTSSAGFTDEDVENMMTFMEAFRTFSRLLFPDTDNNFPTMLSIINPNIHPILRLVEKIRHHFACRRVDVYQYTLTTDEYFSFSTQKSEFELCSASPGCSTTALKQNVQIILPNTKDSKEYKREFDDDGQEPILIQPFELDGVVYCFTLRGPHKRYFSSIDGAMMLAVSPIIERVISKPQETDDGPDELSERLKALLEVAEIISGVLDIDTLVPIIMEKACNLLHSERCSLFLVDMDKKELVTRFHGGLDKSIRMPMNKGIVGQTAMTGKIINITDAYSDDRFDKSVDMKTGFVTRNLMTVPIYNNRGDVSGVTEMINRIEEGPFNDEDIKMLMAFNVFCGISLDNARLYQVSLDLTKQLRSFFEMSSALNTSRESDEIVEEILAHIRSIIYFARATVFISDEATSDMIPFVSIGEPIRCGSIFADQIKATNDTRIFTPEDINVILSTDCDDTKLTSLKKSSKRGSNVPQSNSKVHALYNHESKSSVESDGAATSNGFVCDFPLYGNNKKLIGVMEIASQSKILNEDIRLIECFAVFTAFILDRSELKKVVTLGNVERLMKEWISPNERTKFEIPEKIKVTDEERKIIFSREFDAVYWDDKNNWRVIFEIFNEYDLLRELNITNEKFFRFLHKISSTYKKVPYHNWRHAVDVTQYCSFEIKTCGWDKVLTKFELFGLLVSCICHDANHDGFTNVYNVKAETPLGILFKNSSVMETHHCAIAIDVISKEETNILSELKPDEYKAMWGLIIELILSTDMAKHFTFLKEAKERLEKGPLDPGDPNDRLLAMHLFLKCADISNVSRPFELADKWCDVLCEEFFRQGDLEMANGMEYTSDLNDRAHLNKPKSQIGFYTFVCLPLYNVASEALPPLQCNTDQINSNLAIWKNRTEQAST